MKSKFKVKKVLAPQVELSRLARQIVTLLCQAKVWISRSVASGTTDPPNSRQLIPDQTPYTPDNTSEKRWSKFLVSDLSIESQTLC